MNLPVRSVDEAHLRLNMTREGRELLSHFVALDDVERVIDGIVGVAVDTKRRAKSLLRSYAAGCDVVPYFLFTLKIGELADEMEDAAGIRIICNTFKFGHHALPCVEPFQGIAS